jgi:hypothetical protein
MVEGSRQSLSQGCAAEQSVHPDWRRRIRLAVIQRNTAEAIGLRLMATLDRDIPSASSPSRSVHPSTPR